MQADRGGVTGSTRRVNLYFFTMCDLLPKCRLRLVLLMFIVVQLQLGQVLCLQTTSLRTCSLDAVTPHLAEEVLQVSHTDFCSHIFPSASSEPTWSCRLVCLALDCVHVPHMLSTCLLQIDNWNTFNVFQVGTLSRGSPLETVTLALFARHDLLDKLKIPYDRLRQFVRVSQLVLT